MALICGEITIIKADLIKYCHLSGEGFSLGCNSVDMNVTTLGPPYHNSEFIAFYYPDERVVDLN